MNGLLDIKLSIISPKPQTTRRRVLGILNKSSFQAIFLDTPGILKPRYGLQQKMMRSMYDAVGDADLLLMIVDATGKQHPVDINIQQLNRTKKPVLLLLNKIDLLEKQLLLPLIELYHSHNSYEAIIPISAREQEGLDEVEAEILKYLPLHPPYYPQDILSEHPERFFVAEIIREHIFMKFQQEIPYSTEVEIDRFRENPGRKDYIAATIYVERRSQRGILIGNKGSAIKQVSSSARADIEEFLGRPVFLELYVKVSENWRKDEKKLKRLGY
jgi:GTP-binding protein Era